MKAYKATYNMECLEMTYEVGKTYTHDGQLVMCQKGFHFCKKAQDTLKYYSYDKNFKLMEIDVTGYVIDKGDKSVTNKFTVIRVIPKSEYPELLGLTFDENNNLTKKVDEYGRIILYEYDANNNRKKLVYPDGATYFWEYDENNNLTKLVYPEGETYLYEYDQNNNMIKRVDSDGKIQTFEY